MDDARVPAPSQAWMSMAMGVAGGVAVLAIAAALMSPPADPGPALRNGAASRLASPAAAAPARPGDTFAPAALPWRPGAAEPTVVVGQAGQQPPARVHRDPTAMAMAIARPDAADAETPPPVVPGPPSAMPDAAGRAPRTTPERGAVGEADLGLRVMPGSRPLPDSSRRVPDGAGGEALALSVTASGTLDNAVQYYRQQWLSEGLPADVVQVLRPGDGQALLRAVSPQGGERTVWIVQNGSALDIVLARVRPAPPASR